MLSIVRACAVVGLDGCIIEVETDFNPRAGIPSFSLVGLPGSAVRESRERVRAAIRNSGLQFPKQKLRCQPLAGRLAQARSGL